MGMPVTQLIFDKVVQRDSNATAAKASAAMKMTYMQEREVIQAEMEAKLKEVDQKIEKMDTLMRWTGKNTQTLILGLCPSKAMFSLT